jgi:hypothetical protein
MVNELKSTQLIRKVTQDCQLSKQTLTSLRPKYWQWNSRGVFTVVDRRIHHVNTVPYKKISSHSEN